MKTQTVVATIVIAVFLFAGCATKHNIVIEPSIESLEATRKLPIAVGVYYPTEFKEYVHTRAFSTGRSIAPIGKASEEMISQLLSKTFEEVSKVEELPPYLETKANLVAVIEPTIEYFDFYVPFDKYEEEKGVTYRFTVYALNGVPISSWLVTGQTPPGSKIPGNKRVHLYMEDAAGKIISEMEHTFDDDRLIALLESAGGGAMEDQLSPIDPGQLSTEAMLVTDKKSITQLMGSNLPPEQVALVKLSISNNSSKRLLIRPSDMRLELSGSSYLAPACAPMVCSKFEKTTGVTSGLLGPLAGLAAAGGGSKKRAERMTALKKNQIREGRLQHDDSMEGYLYFLIPEEINITDEAKLSMWVVETDSINGTSIRIPIMRDVAPGN